MKLKITTYLIILSATVLSYSCKPLEEVSVNNSVTTTTKTYDGKTMYVKKDAIIQKPQVAELDVKKQRVKMIKTYEQINLDAVRELAKGDFMVQEKCDVIVEPYLFTTSETTESGTKTTVTITGYPANYINIKNYEKKDEIFFTLPNYVN